MDRSFQRKNIRTTTRMFKYRIIWKTCTETKMLKTTRKYLPKKRTFTAIIYENVLDDKTCIQISL